MGWSVKQLTRVYSKDDSYPKIIEKVDIMGDTVVYAVWGYDTNDNEILDIYEIGYTVTYDANGGEGEVPADENTYLSGENAEAKGQEQLIKDDYVFVGWNTKPDGSGITYQEDDLINIPGNIKLYAKWVTIDEITPPITLDKSSQILWGFMLLLSLSTIVTYFVYEKKQCKQNV